MNVDYHKAYHWHANTKGLKENPPYCCYFCQTNGCPTVLRRYVVISLFISHFIRVIIFYVSYTIVNQKVSQTLWMCLNPLVQNLIPPWCKLTMNCVCFKASECNVDLGLHILQEWEYVNRVCHFYVCYYVNWCFWSSILFCMSHSGISCIQFSGFL